MTYAERIFNSISLEVGKYLFNNIIDEETKLFRRLYGSDFADLKVKFSSCSLEFTGHNVGFNIYNK